MNERKQFIQGINLKPLNSKNLNLEILFLGKAVQDATNNSTINSQAVNYAKNNLRVLQAEKTKRDAKKLMFIVISLMVFSGVVFLLNLGMS